MGKHHCTGVLISRQHVVTSATCLINVSLHTLGITLAEYHLTQDDSNQISQNASSFIKHPKFYQNSNKIPEFNIAVVTIPGVNLTDHISPICWGPLFNGGITNKDESIYSSWGPTQFGASVIPSYAKIPIISNSVCQV